MITSKQLTKLSVLTILFGTYGVIETAYADSASRGPTTSVSGSVTGKSTDNPAGTGWNTEDRYWRENYSSRPYYNNSMEYGKYQPAYRYGVDTYNQYSGRRFDELNESELRSNWDKVRGNSGLNWDQAKEATRDSYNRMYDNSTNAASRGSAVSSGTAGTRNQ